jgi:predicted aspartyl protease
MIRGYFHPDNENTPVIKITIAWEQTVINPHLVLDTGFTGEIKISKQIADELGLKPTAVEQVTNMNGEIIDAPLAFAYVEMEGEKQPVTILILDGMDLAGVGLYTKFQQRVIVDCKNRIVELEKVEGQEFDE